MALPIGESGTLQQAGSYAKPSTVVENLRRWAAVENTCSLLPAMNL